LRRRPRHPDVSKLIAASRGVDGQSLDRLLELYRNYLSLLAKTWMNAAYRGKADPSDVVQDTLWEAHQAFGEFDGRDEAAFAAWLRKILVRNVVDLARRYKTSARDVSREEPWDPGQIVKRIHKLSLSQTSPSQSAQRRELGVVLADALAELSADHRQVIMLRNLQDLPWAEVAKQMGRSDEAVRKLWTRALVQLKPLIEDRL
jgi:RNA polymerase sigma-70 factor (ECF subfamily)